MKLSTSLLATYGFISPINALLFGVEEIVEVDITEEIIIVNECADSNLNNCNLNAVCTDTTDGFDCECYDGYAGDGVTCDDVDECAVDSLNNCDFNAGCTNTPGAFTCACDSGYAGDGVTCDDVNECAVDSLNNCDFNAGCTNTPGAFTCACDSGYAGDGVTCDDIDECADDSLNNCDFNAGCTNTPGAFTCACDSGYVGDGVTCDDVDECADDSLNNCDTNADCTNTPGAFTCACSSGYTGNGIECSDVDECADDSLNNCDSNADCTNTPGDFTCVCVTGYEGDGTSCSDIDECANPDFNDCDDNAVCTNTVGSYTCECDAGYEGDGETCDDIDECATENGGCVQICENTMGAFECSCNDGYVLAEDALGCDDIDECLEEPAWCSDYCTNSVGSYECSCDDGFILSHGHTCIHEFKCMVGWGDDIENCYPQNALLECTSTGFILQLALADMYETVGALNNDQRESALYLNGEEVTSFDSNGGAIIAKNWNELTDVLVSHNNDGEIEFAVQISAEDPVVIIGDFSIHITRTESFTMVCHYPDNALVSTDAKVMVSPFGVAGELDEYAANDVWLNSFNLDVYSDNVFETEITDHHPIALGSPVFAQISAVDLPNVLQYYVSNCYVTPDADVTVLTEETEYINIFDNYECYNPIFGNAESIFMGRPAQTAANMLNDYQFSFPAFTFNALVDEQLHMTCSITICPADDDCIATSYSDNRGNTDDQCYEIASEGFKWNSNDVIIEKVVIEEVIIEESPNNSNDVIIEKDVIEEVIIE